MDQFFFRIALCACLCLGGLQASPVRQCKIDRDDVMLELDNVLCENVTLSTPTNVTTNRYDDALQHYIKQLFLVHENCTNTDFVMDNVEALQSCKPQPANYTLTLRTHNTFESFKTALETFVQEYNVGRKK